MTTVLVAALVWAVLATLFTWFWNNLCRHNRRLDAAVERHPANGCDDWTPPDPQLFPFRARPCRHQLWAPTLDETEMEHQELLHVDLCPVAQELTGRNAA